MFYQPREGMRTELGKALVAEKEWKQMEQELSRNHPHTHAYGNSPMGEIRTIARGFASGGLISSGKKVHTRKAWYDEVYMADHRPSKQRRNTNTPVISFREDDEEGVLYPHDDTLEVTILITNFMTIRILINNGIFTNIIFSSAFT